jgi:hypothetical protein
MRIPIGGGVPQLVLESETGIGNYRCVRALESFCILPERSQDKKQITLTEFDPLKGRVKILRTIPNDPDYTGGTLSPDGSTFAIARVHDAEVRIKLISLQGSADREITLNGWRFLTCFEYSADGNGFYLTTVQGQGTTLLYFGLNGDAHTLWQLRSGETCGLPSPDGRYLAVGAFQYNTNVWIAQGF